MDVKALERHMAHYNQWKQQLDRQLQSFAQWVKDHGLVSKEVSTHLQRARFLLDGDSFTIACVGEFSRGKTELLNALLFGAKGRRMLPSQPGRTTMCPTEILADPTSPNCVRLLPIETRSSTASLQSFRRIPEKWITLRFNPNDNAEMATAIGQVSAQKWVTPEEALRLGFSDDELSERNAEGKVSVPTWRHALISLDHPLLRQGLRIVDTPGLNALGNEPELTLKTLPEAQAILFLLAADSGVSASDMAIWREHIQGLRETRCTAVLALLNKIDTLWDDLLPQGEVAANIEQMRLQTARLLKLAPEQVLAISAKQALLARANNQPGLLQRSNFLQLERMLAECILRRQQQIANHSLIVNSRDMVLNTYKSLERRLQESQAELRQLRESRTDQHRETLQKLRDSIRQQHNRYHKQALSLKTSQRLLANQRQSLLAPISSTQLEQQITNAQRQLTQSWTTIGLSRAIGDFFDTVDSNILHLEREVERANRVLASIYARSESNGESVTVEHQLLNLIQHKRQLNQLKLRAGHFRSSLNSVLTSKGNLINRFIATLVQEVRDRYQAIQKSIETWLETALIPLVQSNQYQKQLLEHHMLRLTRLQGQNNDRNEQLEALQTNVYQLRNALNALLPLKQHLSETPAPVASADILSLDKVRQAQGGA